MQSNNLMNVNMLLTTACCFKMYRFAKNNAEGSKNKKVVIINILKTMVNYTYSLSAKVLCHHSRIYRRQ